MSYYTFYLCKGVTSANGKETWAILKIYKNQTNSFRRTFIDKLSDDTNVMYRIMSVDNEQHIEFTPIRCLNNRSKDIIKLASNN